MHRGGCPSIRDNRIPVAFRAWPYAGPSRPAPWSDCWRGSFMAAEFSRPKSNSSGSASTFFRYRRRFLLPARLISRFSRRRYRLSSFIVGVAQRGVIWPHVDQVDRHFTKRSHDSRESLASQIKRRSRCATGSPGFTSEPQGRLRVDCRPAGRLAPGRAVVRQAPVRGRWQPFRSAWQCRHGPVPERAV